MKDAVITRLTLHQQIEKKLRKHILYRLKPGQKLESEVQLAERFDLSVATIREAITTFVHEGLVERRPGRGTTVTRRGCRGRVAILLGVHPQFPWQVSYYASRIVVLLRDFFAAHAMRVETSWPRYLKEVEATDLEYEEFRHGLEGGG